MSLATFIILANLAGFSMLFVVLLARRRVPRVTTITRSTSRDAIAIPSSTNSDDPEN